MALYNFHRVFISVTILFLFGYGLYAFRQGGSVNTGMGLGALIVCAATVAYLIHFNYRLRVLNHAIPVPRQQA